MDYEANLRERILKSRDKVRSNREMFESLVLSGVKNGFNTSDFSCLFDAYKEMHQLLVLGRIYHENFGDLHSLDIPDLEELKQSVQGVGECVTEAYNALMDLKNSLEIK